MHGGNGCGPNKCKALLMLVFGVLFLLGTTGVWAEFTFAKYWPLPIALLGLHNLVCPCWKRCSDGSCECCGGKKMK